MLSSRFTLFRRFLRAFSLLFVLGLYVQLSKFVHRIIKPRQCKIGDSSFCAHLSKILLFEDSLISRALKWNST
jgi:hypothetical protein